MFTAVDCISIGLVLAMIDCLGCGSIGSVTNLNILPILYLELV